jgi:hypothetical protein
MSDNRKPWPNPWLPAWRAACQFALAAVGVVLVGAGLLGWNVLPIALGAIALASGGLWAIGEDD